MPRRPWEREIEPWFVRNGLPYFVPAERERRPPRCVRARSPLMLLVGWARSPRPCADVGDPEAAFAPATLTLIAVLAAGLYAVTALRARPILGWALRRTRGSVRQLLPMVTRALPLLLLFITFLFINAEVWQLSATLDGSVLWLTLLLFAVIAVGFLLVRLPEEVDRVDDFIDVDAGAPGHPRHPDRATRGRAARP